MRKRLPCGLGTRKIELTSDVSMLPGSQSVRFLETLLGLCRTASRQQPTAVLGAATPADLLACVAIFSKAVLLGLYDHYLIHVQFSDTLSKWSCIWTLEHDIRCRAEWRFCAS